jgi:cellulose synthase/poly-beta-1,6-N-acetylglucosamine synthase-like glycosyltransferase
VNEASTCPAGHRAGQVVRDGVSVFHGQSRDRYRCELPDGSFHRFLDDRGQHAPSVGSGPRRTNGLSPAVGRHYTVSEPVLANDVVATVPAPRLPIDATEAASNTALLVDPLDDAELLPPVDGAVGAGMPTVAPPRRTDTSLLAVQGAPSAREPRLTRVLPSPPTDEEKYRYLQSQGRWYLWACAGTGALVMVSLVRFAMNHPIGWGVLALVLLRVATSAVGLVSSSRRGRVSVLDHENRVLTWAPGEYPSVDVFLPSAGEDLEVLHNTYHHVSLMEWPGELEVHVLDDSARPEVATLAAAYGFAYHSRPDRGRMKKAGNLKYGFEHSTGDLIAVFDADFVPRPEYLSELVPYFDDPTVGIVQSPQFFDTSRGMNWLQRGAGATQELFYRMVQPSRDAARAAICVGTCAVYRRSALDQSGGFAQIGHSEDVHTGVNLLKVGFFVRYVPVLVSKGLCPDTLAGFLNQQYRWCTGSMSLLADRAFHAAPLNLKQRLCFFSGFLYYISTAVFVFTVAVPSLVMVWLYADLIVLDNYRLLLPSVVVTFVLAPAVMYGRWRPEVLRVQMIYSFAHAVAVFHTLQGRTADWVPTGAATKGTPLAVQIRRVMTVTVLTLQALLWCGIARALPEVGIDRLWPMVVLAAISAYVQLPALLPMRASRPEPEAVRVPQPSRLAMGGAAYPPALNTVAPVSTLR